MKDGPQAQRRANPDRIPGAEPGAGRGRPGAIAELQGLYGPFTFSERLFQQIWLRRDFDGSAMTAADGRRVRIVHAGRWNRLGGPDFKDARVQLDGGEVRVGDVELHLHAEDWSAHGHARDRAYDGVILHVVLFPPPPGAKTMGNAGREIPVLALLPWLHHDLEEYAAEEAVEHLANRPVARIFEELGKLPLAELDRKLRGHAERRWLQKVHFARLRVQRLGWESACHHTALEILGYRFNRAPMLRIAGRWPLAAWTAGAVDPEEVVASETEGWVVQGVRPANHPRTRLRQYAAWTAARGDWSFRLAAWGKALPVVADGDDTGRVRRSGGFRALRDEISAQICGAGMGGTRFDNLVCDGFLPLLAADGGRNEFGFWFHWFAGDLPEFVVRALRDLGIFGGPRRPASHGAAQGLLGWLIETEHQTSAAAGSGA